MTPALSWRTTSAGINLAAHWCEPRWGISLWVTYTALRVTNHREQGRNHWHKKKWRKKMKTQCFIWCYRRDFLFCKTFYIKISSEEYKKIRNSIRKTPTAIFFFFFFITVVLVYRDPQGCRGGLLDGGWSFVHGSGARHAASTAHPLRRRLWKERKKRVSIKIFFKYILYNDREHCSVAFTTLSANILLL